VSSGYFTIVLVVETAAPEKNPDTVSIIVLELFLLLIVFTLCTFPISDDDDASLAKRIVATEIERDIKVDRVICFVLSVSFDLASTITLSRELYSLI